MKRLSGLVAFASLLCFLPCAFGQSRVSAKPTSTVHSVLNFAPSSLLAFALASGNDLHNGNNGKGGKGSVGGYGPGPIGYGPGGPGYGNGPNGGGCSYTAGKVEKCAAMPEGGTTLMYVLLAGLSSLGAIVLRSRRQASTPETN